MTATGPLPGPVYHGPAASAALPWSTRRLPQLSLSSGRSGPSWSCSRPTCPSTPMSRPFAQTFPERFFQVGMAEQNMMGIAGGLAKTGCLPVAVTYCVFATRRAGDQVQMALSTGHHTAVVAAFLPGITTPFRASHQGNDDLAIIGAVPGMTVIDPMDATELIGRVAGRGRRSRRRSTFAACAGQVPAVLDGAHRFRYRSHPARCATAASSASSAPASAPAGRWKRANYWRRRRAIGGCLHVPTLKPFDAEAVAAFAAVSAAVVTVENHSIIGGLGSAVCEAVAEARHPAAGSRAAGSRTRWGEAGPLDYLRSRLEP